MNRPVKAGLVILGILLFAALSAPLLAPCDPYELGIPYQKPSAEHLLGTNDVGQDIFSELIYGTRVSLLIGVVSALAVTIIGTVLGVLAGYFGGWIDRLIVQITNVAMALPSLALTIVLVAFLETNLKNLIIAICATAWTSTVRIIRSRVLQIRELPFIKLETTMGASSLYIMFRHILPNLGEIVFVRGVMGVAGAMLTEASLSFLGLGTLGQKSWGSILHYAFYRNGILNGYYWWYLPPMFCISLSVLGFMLLGYYGKTDPKKKAGNRPGQKD
ncbi:MAG: ABC transporter permease [Candidatus Limivivens sp.]|nr:ABC transporter permease [Candidatus Limivivens sp.]